MLVRLGEVSVFYLREGGAGDENRDWNRGGFESGFGIIR